MISVEEEGWPSGWISLSLLQLELESLTVFALFTLQVSKASMWQAWYDEVLDCGKCCINLILGFPGTALESALTMPAQQAIDGGGFLDSECPRSGSEQIHWVAQCKEHTLDWHQLAGGTCYNLAPPRGLAVLVCATANAIDRHLAAWLPFLAKHHSVSCPLWCSPDHARLILLGYCPGSRLKS